MILGLVTVLLLVALTLGAYADRVYAELGKFSGARVAGQRGCVDRAN